MRTRGEQEGGSAGRKGSRLLPPTSSASQPPDGGCRAEKGHGIGQRGCRKDAVQNPKNQELSSFSTSSPSNEDRGRRSWQQHKEENAAPFSPHGECPPSSETDLHRASHIHNLCWVGFSSTQRQKKERCADRSTEGSGAGFWSSRASVVTPMRGRPRS